MHEGGDEAVTRTATASTEYDGRSEYPDPVRGLPECCGRFTTRTTRTYRVPGTQCLPTEGPTRIPGASSRYGYRLLQYSVLFWRSPVDSAPISNKFRRLRVIFSAHCGRPYGRPGGLARVSRLSRPVASCHSRKATQDNSTPSARSSSARLGSPSRSSGEHTRRRRMDTGPASGTPGPPAFLLMELRRLAGARTRRCRD